MGALTIDSISRTFGQTRALDNTSIEVPGGSFLALLGPSGCGKTTTLRIVAGFDQPDTGDVRIDGKSVLHLPPNKRRLGMMFQDYALFPHMTIEDNVGFGLKMNGITGAESTRRIGEALELVRLSHTAKRYPSELSGGQRQRIALARSLVVKPDVLLLDEPLAALDKNLRESMQFELKHIQITLGITTVMVTHDQEEALTLADQVAVMNAGRIMQRGTPREVYENPANAFVSEFLGTANLFSGSRGVDAAGREVLNVPLQGRDPLQLLLPKSVPEAAQLTLGVRPEKLRITRSAPQDTNRLKASVRAHAFRGPASAYELSFAGRDAELVAYSQTSSRFLTSVHPVGSEVWLSWEPEDAFVFPA